MNRRLSDVTTPSPFSLVFVNLVLLTLCYHCQIRRTLLSSGVVLVDETGGNLPDPRKDELVAHHCSSADR